MSASMSTSISTSTAETHDRIVKFNWTQSKEAKRQYSIHASQYSDITITDMTKLWQYGHCLFGAKFVLYIADAILRFVSNDLLVTEWNGIQHYKCNARKRKGEIKKKHNRRSQSIIISHKYHVLSSVFIQNAFRLVAQSYRCHLNGIFLNSWLDMCLQHNWFFFFRRSFLLFCLFHSMCILNR